MKILALIPDAFGGHGGISVYNRDFLTALCNHPDCKEVVAIPRLMPNPPEATPENLTYITTGINNKVKYLYTFFKSLSPKQHFHLIICGHINLLPLAFLARLILRAPILLEIYGIEAWQPTPSTLTNKLVSKIDAFVSISEITRKQFLLWSQVTSSKGHILPNAIHLEQYGTESKNPGLSICYGLEGKTVLMTLGRLVSHERAKGFDEVLEALPQLTKEVPNIVYLIVGKGNDRKRLEEKAQNLGVQDRVIFSGFIAEEEKADIYRLADAYIMPSRGEGFGFVFLEAMACGIPVVASVADGSREAVRDGQLGLLVDPDSQEQLIKAILKAVSLKKKIPHGLDYFSYNNFTMRLKSIIDQVILS